MESSIKLKDTNCNGLSSASSGALSNSGGGGVTAQSICSSDSFNIMPPHHELVSANSIELNAAASLSDDSGVPLTTNSSISSGDSYRIGMCKFEIEMVESDGEVSQFDSLDNCSEGGMSAENFNTLKKGPLAPIDPPPEFQDSPQTTLVRSISKNIVNSLRRWTSSQSSFDHLKDYGGGVGADDVTMVSTMTAAGTINNELVLVLASGVGVTDPPMACLDARDSGIMPLQTSHDTQDRTLKESYSMNKHLYSSDSILNSHTDNIYDEPNMISSSLGNSVDIIDDSDQSSSSPLPSPPPPVSLIKIKQTLCPYYQDHTRYFKAIPTEQDSIASAKAAAVAAQQRFNTAGLSEIHDYDLYYGAKRQHDSLHRRQLLYSPLGGHTNHCHYHHHHMHHAHPHHHHVCGQRPNSRNSLNSRLSSSHNSLNVSSANKLDDSIFITQAMSHDALFTREISDFYNVPIDSDIYAFPVDMIEQQHDTNIAASSSKQSGHHSTTSKTGARRNKRNKRKHRHGGAPSMHETSDDCGEKSKHGKYRTPTNALMPSAAPSSVAFHSENERHEPLHMTLDEVKQFYHTLYSDAGKTTVSVGIATAGSLHHGIQVHTKPASTNGFKSSNETIWSISTNATTTTTRARSSVGTARSATGSNSEKYLNKQNKHNLDNDKLNNNNTMGVQSTNAGSGGNYQPQMPAQHLSVPEKLQTSEQLQQQQQQQQHQQLVSHNNKHVEHTEKKSQFSLNLKQKFCSIFRFRRSNHSRCRATAVAAAAVAAAAGANADETHTCLNRSGGGEQSVAAAADLRKKFQSRALPPLPQKAYAIDIADSTQEEPKKVILEPRALQFTSSIEKVKDYGWYWGPLSSEAAEKVLSNEPDGSFIVRDSSDDHYIFSLSFKLNNCVRHVRIEQDQGTFSFGSYAKFKSQTITEFIEKAVEHSRSGRYLFFLHRRPEHGPMRVQLTNPVSRFKHVQSLQHMCRFVILKAVIRKDLIQTLPLPRRLLDYLNYKHCYSEQVESDSSHSQISGDGSM